MAIEPALDHISLNIAHVRGQRVILDADLAALYDVQTKPFDATWNDFRRISCLSSPQMSTPL
jgi:hypothetical protein